MSRVQCLVIAYEKHVRRGHSLEYNTLVSSDWSPKINSSHKYLDLLKRHNGSRIHNFIITSKNIYALIGIQIVEVKFEFENNANYVIRA